MYGFTDVCIAFSWYVKLDFQRKLLLHPGAEHVYGRSPVCILMCALRLECSVLVRAQLSNGHAYTSRNPWLVATVFLMGCSRRPMGCTVGALERSGACVDSGGAAEMDGNRVGAPCDLDSDGRR